MEKGNEERGRIHISCLGSITLRSRTSLSQIFARLSFYFSRRLHHVLIPGQHGVRWTSKKKRFCRCFCCCCCFAPPRTAPTRPGKLPQVVRGRDLVLRQELLVLEAGDRGGGLPVPRPFRHGFLLSNERCRRRIVHRRSHRQGEIKESSISLPDPRPHPTVSIPRSHIHPPPIHVETPMCENVVSLRKLTQFSSRFFWGAGLHPRAMT